MSNSILRRMVRVLHSGFQGAVLGIALAGCVVYHYDRVDPGPDQFESDRSIRARFTLEDGTEIAGIVASVDASAGIVSVAVDRLGRVDVDLREVTRAQVGHVDVGLSILASVGATAGVAGAAIGIILVIAILAKSSCPFIYVDGPDGPVLVGEGYSGAVVGALQRADRVALPAPTGPTMSVTLSDEARETQYTDAAWLVVVDHAPGQRALATTDGRTLLAGPMLPADRVEDLYGADLTTIVANPDAGVWATDMAAATRAPTPPHEEGLTARLRSPPGGVALELEFGNTPWLDAVSGQLWAGLGGRLDEVQAHDRDPAERERMLTKLRTAGVHSAVEVRQVGSGDGGADGWRRVVWIAPPGWVATRRVVVPLDGVAPGQPLEVRLTGGVGFLRVAYMGFTTIEAAPPQETVVRATIATGPDDRDERAALAAVDGRYQVLPDRGAKVSLSFDLPPARPDQIRSTFLHLDGYYEVHRREDARFDPQRVSLLAGHPERVSAFSVGMYRAFLDRLQVADAAPTP